MSNTEELLEKYVNEARRFYPNLAYGMSSGSSVGTIESKREFNFFNHQQVLSGTDYYPTSNSHFIHYTNLDTLFNIINTKGIRLYNLDNLNDKTELLYAAKSLDLNLNESQITEFRRSYFVHSLCQYDTSHLDDFNLWRLYGQNGNGVGIVYEITNLSDQWYQCFLGKINYEINSASSQALKSFIQFHNEFMLANNDFLANIPTFILMLLLFHKNAIWSIENEYRLILNYTFEKDTLDLDTDSSNFYFEDYLNHTVNNNRNETAYITLPLSPFNENDFHSFRHNLNQEQEKLFLTTVPSLKISKIILGYNYSEKQLEEIRYLVFRLSGKKLGYYIPVEISPLIKEI